MAANSALCKEGKRDLLSPKGEVADWLIVAFRGWFPSNSGAGKGVDPGNFELDFFLLTVTAAPQH